LREPNSHRHDLDLAAEGRGQDGCVVPWHHDGQIGAAAKEIPDEVVTRGPGSTRHEGRYFPHQHEDARTAGCGAEALVQLALQLRIEIGAAPISTPFPWDRFPIDVEALKQRIAQVEIENERPVELCAAQIGTCKARARKVRIGEVRAFEMRPVKPSALHLRGVELGTGQPDTLQAGISQLRVAQVHAFEGANRQGRRRRPSTAATTLG
jgi:hypothetical protein